MLPVFWKKTLHLFSGTSVSGENIVYIFRNQHLEGTQCLHLKVPAPHIDSIFGDQFFKTCLPVFRKNILSPALVTNLLGEYSASILMLEYYGGIYWLCLSNVRSISLLLSFTAQCQHSLCLMLRIFLKINEIILILPLIDDYWSFLVDWSVSCVVVIGLVVLLSGK
jgi:hypothetical protein